MQAVHMAKVATLADIGSVQQFSFIAFDTTSVVRAATVVRHLRCAELCLRLLHASVTPRDCALFLEQDTVKVGIAESGGFIAYTLLEPSRDSRVTIKISTGKVDGQWTMVSSHAVINGSIDRTALGPSEPFSVR